MVTKQQQHAAATRARAARHCTQAVNQVSDSDSNDMSVSIEADSDDQDCRYMGGVDYQFSGTEYDSGQESEWSDGSESDEESLVELEGDELEANLHKLRQAQALEAFLKYAQIVMNKSASEWKKAEKNRALGYTGNSKCTQQWREKEAWDRASFHEEAEGS
jgi:hypothetical protein